MSENYCPLLSNWLKNIGVRMKRKTPRMCLSGRWIQCHAAQSWNHRQEMQLRGEVTPHIGRHAFAVLAILKGMLLETLQKVFGHKSITYVLRIHSLVRRRRGNLFLEVAHLYDQRADQLSQLLIRACFNNCQFHTKILFKILNMRQSNAHPISFPNR